MKIFVSAIVGAVCLAALSCPVLAADVRGKVERISAVNGNRFPAAKEKVSIVSSAVEPATEIISTYTASDGFFYFYGLGAGTRYVKVRDDIYKVTVPDTSKGHNIGPYTIL